MAASKSSAKAPAFQFYPKDFLSDSNQVAMSLQEAGAYIRLMCHCWDDGSIPDDPIRLARIIGATGAQMQKLWPAIRHCFREQPKDSGRMVHPRLEKERQKQADYRRRQSDRAAKRWDKSIDATAVPRHSHGSASALRPPHVCGNALLSSSSSSSADQEHMRARGTNPSNFPDDVLARVSGFLERYRQLHIKLRNGAHYLGSPQKDFAEAALLCEAYDDERLDRLATVWLTTDHDFAENGTRTLAKFRSMASWCDDRLRQKGL